MRNPSLNNLTRAARVAGRLSRSASVARTLAPSRMRLRTADSLESDRRPTPARLDSPLPGLPVPAGGGVRLSPWVAGAGLAAAAYLSDARTSADLENKHAWSRTVDLGGVAKTSVKLSEELVAPDHALIDGHPVRKRTTQAIMDTGAEVRWLDAAGALELKAGVERGFPLASMAQGTAGFESRGLIEYRVLTPMYASTDQALAVTLNAGTLVIPTCAESLVQVPPGSVYEVSGQGKIHARGQLESTRGAAGMLMTALGTMGAHAQAEISGRIKLRVEVLDGAGRVAVRVEKENARGAGFRLFLKTNLGLDDEAIDALGQDDLQRTLIARGRGQVADWWKQYENSEIHYSSHHDTDMDTVGEFVLDTSSPHGARAYRALLGLDLEAVHALTRATSHGIDARTEHAARTEHGSHLELGLAGHRMLLSKALAAERSGDVIVNGERIQMYREKESTHTAGSFLVGYETIKWGAVSVMTERDSPVTTYYNLKYDGDDWLTTESEVSRFFEFADALGVENAVSRKRDESGMGWLSRIFSSRDDTKVKVDMYFTQHGVDQIARSSYEEAQRAILAACAALNPGVAGIESLTVDQLDAAVDMAWDLRQLMEDGGPGAMMGSDCLASRQYRAMTGRELMTDMDAIELAHGFMSYKGCLAHDATEEERRSFFTELGSAQRFRYKPAMIALAKLAGRDNTLVDALSMVGQETELVAASEGAVSSGYETAV
ncbi:MAG: hypothetical protein VX834_10675 [Myxococcota bacterium]|nr:hypothetical protein [Myxococcota bacterium]